MPNRLIDLTGRKFGKLTVIERAPERSTRGLVMWVCRCDCGNTKSVAGKYLRNGQTKSCGRCKAFTAPLFVRTHKNRLYHTWSEMKRRCIGRCTNHQYYGDKGISYCPEWEDFNAFAQWAINSGYSPGLEIDRIDGDENYTPDNCRWVSHKDNSRNRKARANNKTGVPGVHPRQNRSGKIVYRATISTDSGKVNLGTFETIDEAAKARREAELKYWGFNIGE